MKNYPEIIVWNAHNGTSSIRAEGGIFQMVCSNGLTIRTEKFGDLRIRHDNPYLDDSMIAYELAQFSADATKSADIRHTWRDIQMDSGERMNFYRAAAQLRSTDMSEHHLAVFDYPQREEDTSHDLWTVFNRTQEYLVRGGYATPNASGRGIRMVREITGINSLERVNRELFDMANTVAMRN
jgi:hypothetical protein